MLIFVGLITSTGNVKKKFNVIFVVSGGIASFEEFLSNSVDMVKNLQKVGRKKSSQLCCFE